MRGKPPSMSTPVILSLPGLPKHISRFLLALRMIALVVT